MHANLECVTELAHTATYVTPFKSPSLPSPHPMGMRHANTSRYRRLLLNFECVMSCAGKAAPWDGVTVSTFFVLRFPYSVPGFILFVQYLAGCRYLTDMGLLLNIQILSYLQKCTFFYFIPTFALNNTQRTV